MWAAMLGRPATGERRHFNDHALCAALTVTPPGLAPSPAPGAVVVARHLIAYVTRLPRPLRHVTWRSVSAPWLSATVYIEVMDSSGSQGEVLRRAYHGLDWKGRRRKRRENQRRARVLHQALGIEIAVRRITAGLRAAQAAGLAGIRSGRYSDIEDGHGATVAELDQIAALFDTSVAQLHSAARARIDEGRMPASRFARDYLGEAVGYTRPDDWFVRFVNDAAPTSEPSS